MPSPVGHALGGMIAGGSTAPRLLSARQVAAFAALGVLPDLDLLVGSHSTYTHSLGATVLVGAVALGCTRSWRIALASCAAYSSHILLDWLGNDTSAPIGIMALWPFTSAFYQSNAFVFEAITRRYWLDEFWAHNLRALIRELIVLGPLAAAVWWWKRRA